MCVCVCLCVFVYPSLDTNACVCVGVGVVVGSVCALSVCILQAEKGAKKLSEEGEIAKEKESRKMEEEHKANEEDAISDHRRYSEESKRQVAIQDAGHRMEAVPTARLAPEEARSRSSRYFGHLEGKATRVMAREAQVMLVLLGLFWFMVGLF